MAASEENSLLFPGSTGHARNQCEMPKFLTAGSGYACRGGGCHWHSCGLGSSLKPHPRNNSTGVQVREDKYPEVWRAPGSANQKAAIERYKVHPPKGRKRYMQRGGE